jgi:hypothetical protein
VARPAALLNVHGEGVKGEPAHVPQVGLVAGGLIFPWVAEPPDSCGYAKAGSPRGKAIGCAMLKGPAALITMLPVVTVVVTRPTVAVIVYVPGLLITVLLNVAVYGEVVVTVAVAPAVIEPPLPLSVSVQV